MRIIFAFFAMAVMAAPAEAAVLVTNGLGKLTGITGLNVNGTNYNVSFQGGTCVDVLAGCDGSTFTFDTEQDSTAASWAILEAIESDPIYDGAPWLTSGCTNRLCIIDVPFALSAGIVFSSAAYNVDPTWPMPDNVMPDSFYASLDYGGSRTFALFSPSTAAVPEPASWAMMLLGFLGIGMAARRSCKPALAQLA
jgi:hypothetical protein